VNELLWPGVKLFAEMNFIYIIYLPSIFSSSESERASRERTKKALADWLTAEYTRIYTTNERTVCHPLTASKRDNCVWVLAHEKIVVNGKAESSRKLSLISSALVWVLALLLVGCQHFEHCCGVVSYM
jgi:hypothetical protein